MDEFELNITDDITFDEWFDLFKDHCKTRLKYTGPIDKYTFEGDYEEGKTPEFSAASFVNEVRPKIIYLKIVVEGSSPLISSIEDAKKWLEAIAQDGDSAEEYTISVVKMTEEEYKNLPEHKGF